MRRVAISELLKQSFAGEWGTEDGARLTPVLRTANFNSDGSFDYGNPAYRCIPEKKVAAKRMIKGDVVLEKSGGTPNRPVGILAYYDSDDMALCSNFNHVLRFNEKKILPRYAFHQLRWLRGKGAFEPYTRKTTGLQNLQMSKFVELEMLVPQMEHQVKLVTSLDAIGKLQKSLAAQLESLDYLVKSRFVEMFGSPRNNDKKWDEKPLGDVCETRLGKMLDAKKQTGQHLFPYLANTNVQWFRFDLANLSEMDFAPADRVEFELCDGDVLATEGGEVGRCAIWRCELENCYFQKAIHRIRCDERHLIPEYFVWAFKMKSDYGLFDPYTTKSTIAHLTGKKIKQVPLQLPPIALQQEFAAFVQQVDKLRFDVQHSIDRLQMLYDSLAQEYFSVEEVRS